MIDEHKRYAVHQCSGTWSTRVDLRRSTCGANIQSTSLITTLGGASKKCPYSRSVVIPEVSLYVLQLEGTLLWAWKCCRYSRIVVISEVVISEVDCTSTRAPFVQSVDFSQTLN